MQECVVHADLLHCCYRDCICVAGWRHLATDVLARPAGSLRSWLLRRRWVVTFIIWQTNSLWPEAIISLVCKSNKSVCYHGNTTCLFCADGSSATLCCGSSVEEPHLHTGALWQLHRAAGETPPKHLQVRPAVTLRTKAHLEHLQSPSASDVIQK